jgi:hypothetical protein
MRYWTSGIRIECPPRLPGRKSSVFIIVDIDPTDKDNGITKIGKGSYQTAERAEEDVKRLCKELEAKPIARGRSW